MSNEHNRMALVDRYRTAYSGVTSARTALERALEVFDQSMLALDEAGIAVVNEGYPHGLDFTRPDMEEARSALGFLDGAIPGPEPLERWAREPMAAVPRNQIPAADAPASVWADWIQRRGACGTPIRYLRDHQTMQQAWEGQWEWGWLHWLEDTIQVVTGQPPLVVRMVRTTIMQADSARFAQTHVHLSGQECRNMARLLVPRFVDLLRVGPPKQSEF